MVQNKVTMKDLFKPSHKKQKVKKIVDILDISEITV